MTTNKEPTCTVENTSSKVEYVTLRTSEITKNKIASLTLALQAAHKGLHRLSKKNALLESGIVIPKVKVFQDDQLAN